jgi:hypothetical protein
MGNSNRKKELQLDSPIGTATARLRKSIMFQMSQKLEMDICYQCGERIVSVNDFTIEHKIPWLDSKNPKQLFYDLDNIAFSHHSCNIRAAKRVKVHGQQRYARGCRCAICRDAHASNQRNYLDRKRVSS